MPSSHERSPQPRALLVEDSPVNQVLMHQMLADIGCLVSLAKNGRDAVTMFVDSDFDIVLMDVQMPVMDGLAATRLIRQHEYSSGHHTPIIAVTAGYNRESCLDAGMDDHLFKPVHSADLEQVVKRLISVNLPAEPA